MIQPISHLLGYPINVRLFGLFVFSIICRAYHTSFLRFTSRVIVLCGARCWVSGWRGCVRVCMGCVCVCLMPSTQILFLYGQAAAIYSRLHGPLIPSLPPSQPSLPHTVLPFSPALRHFFPSPNKLLFSSYNTCSPTCLSCPTQCPPYPDPYLKSTVSINCCGPS